MSGGPSFPDEALRANMHCVRNMPHFTCHRSPFVRCSVYNKPRLKCMRCCNRTEDNRKSVSRNRINLPSQGMTTLQSNGYVTAELLLLIINIKPLEFPRAIPLATIKDKVVSKKLHKPRHLSMCYFHSHKPLVMESCDIWGLMGVWSAIYSMWRREVLLIL
jgi:hypothetical protein